MSSTTVEKRRIHTVRFTVTGEFVTRHARDKVLEGDWDSAIRFLVENLHGMDYNIAISILSGKQCLIGDSSTEVKLANDSDSGDYLKNLNWMYRGHYQHIDRLWYVPYAIVTNFGERDFSYFKSDVPFSRARYYLNNKVTDKMFVLKCKQMEDYEKAVLFELAKSPPIWLQIKQTPQEAFNAHSDLEVRGHLEWYGKEERPNRSNPFVQPEKVQLKPLEVDTTLTANCGWIMSNGDFYGCSYSGHINLAEQIFEEVLKKETSNAEKDGEDVGWVKIGQSSIGGDPYFLFTKITQAQQDILFDWCKKHKAHYPKDRIEMITEPLTKEKAKWNR
jgi:hypothetical protein